MQRLSYPSETVLTNKITGNRIVLSFKDSLQKPLRPRVCASLLICSKNHFGNRARDNYHFSFCFALYFLLGIITFPSERIRDDSRNQPEAIEFVIDTWRNRSAQVQQVQSRVEMDSISAAGMMGDGVEDFFIMADR